MEIAYTAQLLGVIRSHLEGLQGYDVMALELIQNADDAKAERISFDVSKGGLTVWNSATFSYCGDLATACSLQEKSGYACDYHRITEVASGGKLSNPDNIGRFGIGFVSTYQVTDAPQIRSSGIALTLRPEVSRCDFHEEQTPDGTTFTLPWATNPESSGRKALKVSHIENLHIERLVEDFSAVLLNSLLFLKHVRKAELRRDGKRVLAVELDRGNDSELVVSVSPKGTVERWLVLRADGADAAREFEQANPRLKDLRRSPVVSIGIRLEPAPDSRGILYAYLPTSQTTGLPFHINADFFPEPDRKAVVFTGHQHQQQWNEFLIGIAATEFGKDLESLATKLGPEVLWRCLSAALEVSTQAGRAYPQCFSSFWDRMADAVQRGARIAPDDTGEMRPASAVLLTRQPLPPEGRAALSDVGAVTAAEILRPHRNAALKLGVQEMTLERLIPRLDAHFSSVSSDAVSTRELDSFYRPIWTVIESLVPTSATPADAKHIDMLKGIPFLLASDGTPESAKQCYAVPSPLTVEQVERTFGFLPLAHARIAEHVRIQTLIDVLTIDALTDELQAALSRESRPEDVVGDSPQTRKLAYSLVAKIDEAKPATSDKTYALLRSLPIWTVGTGLASARDALLPGDFADPTGQASLLDPSAMDARARQFVEEKLRVRPQSLESFVLHVLPTFFASGVPADSKKCPALLTELAKNAELLNREELRRALGRLPIVPVMSGAWVQPSEAYFRSDDLADVLGENQTMWADTRQIPGSRSVSKFLADLGVRQRPSARHLVSRLETLADQGPPMKETRRGSERTFYALCDCSRAGIQDAADRLAVERLGTSTCLPADGNDEDWFAPGELHAFFRADAFRSQVDILDFKNAARLHTGLLEDLGIALDGKTNLVVSHLLHCMETMEPVHSLVYQVLNERCQSDVVEMVALRGKPCIYVPSLKRYVRPNQLFWAPQTLGEYAFTIPPSMEPFRLLLTYLGVKDNPAPDDLANILIEITGGAYERQTPVTGSAKTVYENCLEGLATAHADETLPDSVISQLQGAPTLLNLLGRACFPDEVLLQDSEWHAQFFGPELDRALSRPDATLWPFCAVLGARRLSAETTLVVDYTEGERAVETDLAETLQARAGILERMLHDKSRSVRSKIRAAFEQLSAVSYSLVQIKASVTLDEEPIVSPPHKVTAFFDPTVPVVIVASPVSPKAWPAIVTAILHQLMFEEGASGVSTLALALYPLLHLTVEDAHEKLTNVGVPILSDADKNSEEDLTSPELPQFADGKGAEGDSTENARLGAPSADNDAGDLDSTTGTHGTGGRKPRSISRRRKARSASVMKAQWDRRLISYVRPRFPDSNGGEQAEIADENDGNEHNLAVEAASRKLVCDYERSHGRVPTEMSQTNPGFDIVSKEPSGATRTIEVKGIDGEWNQTGVGLSSLQFSNAQDMGDSYWLYVVEHARENEKSQIHLIQNPASLVDQFMFDMNWRGIAVPDKKGPSHLFVAGARVDCAGVGIGTILAVQSVGSNRMLRLDFGSNGIRTWPLDHSKMRILSSSTAP